MRLFVPSVFLVAVLLALAGCVTVGPDYEAPDYAGPDTWFYGVAADLSPGSANLDSWWEGFDDPVLGTLIVRAREANPTLQIAVSRIMEARAERGIATGSLGPQVDAQGNYTRSQLSENGRSPVIGNNPEDSFTLGFDAGWEIDLFGGNQRAIESALAGEEAAIETYRDALVTLYSEVALNYVDLRTFELRLQFARANAELQEQSLQLSQDRFDSGLVPRMDTTRAQTNLSNTRAAIPLLEQQRAFSRNRLATLLGGYPADVDQILEPLPDPDSDFPTPPMLLPEQLPADMIRSRPDVRRAERELAAQTARIGLATSELYPKFTLTGFYQLQSIDAGDLFRGDSVAWGLSPQFRWNLFSSGRVRNSIRVEEARTEQALLTYESTVLQAVEEVENALIGIASERQRRDFLTTGVDASKETVELVEDNYRSGLSDFLTVLDAQRSLATDQDNLATSRGEVSKNFIRLYKALGGGSPPPQEYIDEVETSTARKSGKLYPF